MSFNTHVNNLAAKAGAQPSALTRIRRFLYQDTKLTTAKTFITSHFRYCPAVWHFCGRAIGPTVKLENIQKRALSLVFSLPDSDYNVLLSKANLTSRINKTEVCLLIEVYKSVNNLNPAYLLNLFRKVESSHYTRHSVNGLSLPMTNTVSFGTHSLKYFGAFLWNNLPSDIQTAENLNIFKKRLTMWKGIACRCAYYKS